METTRRNILAAAGGSLLAAGALAGPALADEGQGKADTVYGHGMVWNRNLPEDLAELRLSFDLRLDLISGTGLGTAGDPDRPDWGIHFEITGLETEKAPGGEVRYTLRGEVTDANDPQKVGLPVRMIAQTVGDTTAIAIRLGELAFAGAGVLRSGLLLPVKYK